MKLVDANLLLYAIDSSAPRHDRARRWLERELSGTDTIGLSWSMLLAFLRLATSSRVFASPLDAADAFSIVDGWLAQPNVAVVQPTDRHLALMRELLAPLGTAGNLVTDAHLAALAVEHSAQLCSSDSDFARFPGVRWVDPLARA